MPPWEQSFKRVRTGQDGRVAFEDFEPSVPDPEAFRTPRGPLGPDDPVATTTLGSTVFEFMDENAAASVLGKDWREHAGYRMRWEIVNGKMTLRKTKLDDPPD